jgi:Raf kinase inhibitor-like YbhB/YbcL family protein
MGREEDMEFAHWARALSPLCFVPVIAVAAQSPPPTAGGGQRGAGVPAAPAMTLTSTAFPDGGPIPSKYTQAGDQVSPALAWTNTPPNTASFVLHMHDLEVARNHTSEDQLHWLVWNIPASATGLPEGVPRGADLPDGSHQTSASGPVYRGPGAPASGPMHHYTFEIYALDTKLDVPAAADAFETRANVMKAMQGHILGKAVYMGLFHRPQ